MNCISLYTGCGGLDLGFLDAGFKTIWANDISESALQTYEAELKRRGVKVPEIFCGDISSASLPSAGSADVVMGGPPCQGFSVAGKMDVNDPRSRQVWEFFKVVKHVQPRAFVMENVKALGVNKRWSETRKALQVEGAKLGYQTKLFILNAVNFGVPQLRERMFLVGLRDSVMNMPKESAVKLTVREALASIPKYGEKGNDSCCRAIVTPAKSPVLRKSPFAGMLFNGQGRPMDLDAPARTLPASMGGNRTPIIDQESLEHRVSPWVEKYHAQLLKGGGIVDSIPPRLRRLTVEEAAILQGFPAGMSFAGSQCAKFRQIGNSVPPALGCAVATALKKSLEGGFSNMEWQEDQHCWVAEDSAEFHASL